MISLYRFKIYLSINFVKCVTAILFDLMKYKYTLSSIISMCIITFPSW